MRHSHRRIPSSQSAGAMNQCINAPMNQSFHSAFSTPKSAFPPHSQLQVVWWSISSRLVVGYVSVGGRLVVGYGSVGGRLLVAFFAPCPMPLSGQSTSRKPLTQSSPFKADTQTRFVHTKTNQPRRFPATFQRPFLSKYAALPSSFFSTVQNLQVCFLDLPTNWQGPVMTRLLSLSWKDSRQCTVCGKFLFLAVIPLDLTGH